MDQNFQLKYLTWAVIKKLPISLFVRGEGRGVEIYSISNCLLRQFPYMTICMSGFPKLSNEVHAQKNFEPMALS